MIVELRLVLLKQILSFAIKDEKLEKSIMIGYQLNKN